MLTTLNIENLSMLDIGHAYDNQTDRVEIDCSKWLRKYPALTRYDIFVTEPNGLVYCPKTEMEGDKLIWVITDEDTAVPGEGSYQIIASGIYGDRKASKPAGLMIRANMRGLDCAAPPDPSKPWVEKVLRAAMAAEQAALRAEKAAEANAHPPIIGENANWWLWDTQMNAYVDSGFGARGV